MMLRSVIPQEKKFTFRTIKMKRINVAIMTITIDEFYICRRNSNARKLESHFTEHTQRSASAVAMNAILKFSGFYH